MADGASKTLKEERKNYHECCNAENIKIFLISLQARSTNQSMNEVHLNGSVSYLDMKRIALCSHNHFTCWNAFIARPTGSTVTK